VLCAWSDPATLTEVIATSAFTTRLLADVRRRGWAQSIGQREARVAPVSAPVHTSDGELVGAVSISGPIERLGRTPGQRFAPVLITGARRIAAILGR
jgi:DNA-binding IclR family transcriptional regulator